MGRGTGATAEILYGEHNRQQSPETLSILPWRQSELILTPERLKTAGSWFQNFRGWSGAKQWMVRTPKLQPSWIESIRNTTARTYVIDDELIDIVTDPATLEHCEECTFEIDDRHVDEEGDPFIRFESASLRVNQAALFMTPYYLAAVERACENDQGEWMYNGTLDELAYVFENEIIGTAGSSVFQSGGTVYNN